MSQKTDNTPRVQSQAPLPLHRDQGAARVYAQLDRIVAHGEFARSELVKKFLSYIVERTLHPVPNGLKERAIAEAVFERDSDWDAKLDPVVRITAMRLRTKLDAYYASVGQDDDVFISVPKGQYAPIITLREMEPAAPVTVEQSASRRTSAWIALSVLALLVAIVSFATIRNRTASAASTAIPSTPLLTELGKQFAPALSPDGASVAYVWDGDGRGLDIYVKTIATGKVRRITNANGVCLNPAWSPEGKRLAFLRLKQHRMSLIVVSAEGGTETVVADLPAELGNWVGDSGPLLGNPGPEWTHNGEGLIISVATAGEPEHAIEKIDIGTGKVSKTVTTLAGIRDFYPRLSPDGKHIAFVRYASHGSGEVFIANEDGSALRQLTQDHRTIQGIAWAHDSKAVIFSSNRTGSFQLWSSPIERLDLSQLPLSSSSAAQPAVAGNRLLYVETIENWNIWRSEIINGQAGRPERLISSSGRNYDPRLSPDGDAIAFVSDRSGSWQLWLADRNGDNPRQITHMTTAWLGSPAWSPDGKQIAFDARPNGRSGIFAINVATRAVTALQQGGFEARSPSWSRDGTAIYFNCNPDGNIAIYRKHLATGSILKITKDDMFASSEAFDGKTVYFNSTQPGALWRVNSDGSSPASIVQRPFLSPPTAFAVFDRGVYFASDDDNAERSLLNIYANGKVTTIGHTRAPLVPYTPSLNTSSDGNTLLFAEQDQIRSDIRMAQIH
jgi:Tol biopolymer transport system component